MGDRVFAMGPGYGCGRFYDRGVGGRRAMCSVTVGSPASVYSDCGRNGSISTILFPIAYGMLRFTGFTVVEPFLVHAPARLTDAARREHLARYLQRVMTIDQAPTIAYPALDEYDEHAC